MTKAAQAAKRPSSNSVIPGDIEVRVTEFSTFRAADRDNIAKPICDALQGIVFHNDRQIAKLLTEWRDIEGRYKVRFISPAVAKAFISGDEFVWVQVYDFRPREALDQ